jgi:hypothetical protein
MWAQSPLAGAQFHDSHFHLTNYVQEGPSLAEFLKVIGTWAGRVALFGIPLQQQWSFRDSGDMAPAYYLDSDAPLYYYSFTDALIAQAYLSLPAEQRARFDPMITGFNPTDMCAADHIRRVLRTFPGVFTGFGEFTIHKSIKASASYLNRYPGRFLFGTDEVGPRTADKYFKVFDTYEPLWRLLTPETGEKVRKGNYERLFDAARARVRTWERANATRLGRSMKSRFSVWSRSMETNTTKGAARVTLVLILGMLLAPGCAGQPQDSPPASKRELKEKPWLDIYGFAMMDAGYDFKQVDPDWFDVVRPTKLPASKNQFGVNGNTYFSVRQTRFGARSEVPTSLGALKTLFEFGLFGTGIDGGQTTFRLRHAYGELGQFGAGQYWSPFMDADVFPNSLGYWGPNGMVFFRNVQFRWMPIRGDSRVTIAVERPGASADQGRYTDRVELQDVKPRFPMPDISVEARLGRKWGYVEIAGMVRRIEWKDMGTDQFDLSGGAWGWGLNLSSNLKVRRNNVLKLQLVYGEGIQNYMNDAPADIGIRNNFSNPKTPVQGVPLPVLGIVVFYDYHWSDKLSSTIGYSRLDIDNSDGQAASAFRTGQYAVTNLLYYPVKDVRAGGEFQYGYRKNFQDGWSTPDYRIQFSFKFNFAFRVAGN